MTRTDLRQILRCRRQQLTPEAHSKASLEICKRIQALGLIQARQKIAIYIAYGSEVNIMSLVHYAQTINADVYIPLLPKTGHILSFTALSADGYWQKNHLGIQEWISTQILPPQALDIVFTPLLGFDSQGNRLGQGGGYYDRSFAFLRQYDFKKPQLFGVAFDCQKLDNIPVEEWDIPLQGIITEALFYDKNTKNDL